MVYFVMIQSILQYCITARGGLRIVATNKLITAQKIIIKIINNKLKTYPSENLFKDFKVLDVQVTTTLLTKCIVLPISTN